MRQKSKSDYTIQYVCDCQPGWTGEYCTIPVENANSKPVRHQCPWNDEIEIPQNAICDNIVDCPNGEDENGIMAECVVEKQIGYPDER